MAYQILTKRMHVQLKEVITNKLMKLDKVFTSKRRIIIYKIQTKFIRSE